MNKAPSKQLFWIGVLSFFTALIWLALDGYHVLVQKQAKIPRSRPIRPLNPRLAEEVLQILEKRKFYSLEAINESPIKIPSPPEATFGGKITP